MGRARWLRLVDHAAVLAIAVTALAQLWFSPPAGLLGGIAVHVLLTLAFSLPLLCRRRYAVAVFVTVLAAAWLQLRLGGGLGQPFFAVIIALYAVGAHASRPSTCVGPLAVAAQVAVVDVSRLREGAPPDEVVPVWFVLAGTWAFGRWMRRRQRAAVALTERAEAAERDRGEQARRAVDEERARIARELHDLVAHSMSTIVVQSQGAQRVFDASPEQARAALSAIETAGRAGLVEMRRLLGLLTDRGGDDSTAPQPTLQEVGDLVERMRSSGMAVDLRVEGTVRALPPGLELTGYRVVQEAMTNALKHAGQGRVDVRVGYGPEQLDIDVVDRGPGGAEAHGNNGDSGARGLAGMRERLTLYGGTLHTGPATNGGFAVSARIPLEGPP